jgi:hypothetical protein
VRAAATRAALAAAASRASALTNVLSGVGGRGRGTRGGGGAVRVVCSSAAVNCALSSLLRTLPTAVSASRRGAAAARRLAGREASLLRARPSPMTAASRAVHSSRWPSAAAVPSTDSTARPSKASSRTSTSKLWLRASASLGRRWIPAIWPPPNRRSVAATSTEVRDSTPRAASGEATCTRKPARRRASFV